MKKTLILALLLAGCAHKSVAPQALPPTEIIKDPQIVGVACKQVVQLVDDDMDGIATEQELEEKAFRLTRSNAQKQINIDRLKAAALKCGVTILNP